MNSNDPLFFKTHLQKQKGLIMNKAVEFKSQEILGRSEVTDDAEVASQDLNMSLSIYLHERDRNALIQIDTALAKISNGSYGLCETCAEPISLQRLKARPLACLCIECMEDLEESKFFSH